MPYFFLDDTGVYSVCYNRKHWSAHGVYFWNTDRNVKNRTCWILKKISVTLFGLPLGASTS